jgi:hypothetical protein
MIGGRVAVGEVVGRGVRVGFGVGESVGVGLSVGGKVTDGVGVSTISVGGSGVGGTGVGGYKISSNAAQPDNHPIKMSNAKAVMSKLRFIGYFPILISKRYHTAFTM